jgi:hypothetical protein
LEATHGQGRFGVCLLPGYSYRRAVTGSTGAARRAGHQQARIPTEVGSSAAPPNESGSNPAMLSGNAVNDQRVEHLAGFSSGEADHSCVNHGKAQGAPEFHDGASRIIVEEDA